MHAGTTLDAPELLAQVHRAARLMPPGSRIALDGGNALTRLTYFLAADLADCATLLIEPTWTPHERAEVLGAARPTLVTTPRHLERPTNPVCPGERLEWDDRTQFYLATTSGSGGVPKVLVRSRGSWLRSFAALDLGLDFRDRVLIPGPLSSSLFLFGALHALHAGVDVHLLDKWSAAEAAEASRQATAIHLVPAMLAALLSVLERDPVLRAECGLRTVVCGGARVDDALAERLAKVLPGCELVEYYGCAEHSLIAIRRGGPLRPVVDVEVRDPVDGVGELWVRSPLAFDGYLANGRIVPPRSPDGWSTVGDRAVRHPDGSLEILGRASSTINSGAQLVDAEEVESVLRGAAGVLDVLVSATPHARFGELVTAIVEIDPVAPPTLRTLRARAREALEPAKRPRRWLAVRELPRTASGKPARALVAQRLRAGTFAAERL
ncbi:AMP-binding protein [Saccharopolyspora sp. 5N708]|uniref:AMP-binding protein n=1 Tax=Saccharopolyspora sp. 5N708 TaxID=3457424 RepID=UPI003FD4B03F